MSQKAPCQQQQRDIDAEDGDTHRDLKQVIEDDRHTGHPSGGNIIGVRKAVQTHRVDQTAHYIHQEIHRQPPQPFPVFHRTVLRFQFCFAFSLLAVIASKSSRARSCDPFRYR